jgi:predicted exporter
MTAVMLGHGGIHGITLAFGTTLLAVALDYPVHVFSHRLPGPSPWEGLRHNWPTLWIGVTTACIAYLALVFTDFEGLAQLGLFTLAGLLSAALVTRFLLPWFLPEQPLDIRRSPALRWQARLDRLPPLRWLAPAIILFSLLALYYKSDTLWESDLSSLSPVPQELQDADTALRADLATADVRYVALLVAGSEQAALQQVERLTPGLDQLVTDGALGGYDVATRYVPSAATQFQRREALPEESLLRDNLAEAMEGLPFQDGLFDPFVADVALSRNLEPLHSGQLAGTLLEPRVAALLTSHQNRWVALIPLHGLKDPGRVQFWGASQGETGLHFLDLKLESEALVGRFRMEMLERVGVAVVVMVVVMGLGLRRKRGLPLVVLPAAATVLSVAAATHLLGIRLNLFHLVSLMLVMGITIDYALYLSRDEQDVHGRARSLHSLLVCCLSTTMGFGILALSDIPVLKAIGATVASGVIVGLVLGVLGARAAHRHT